MNPQKGVLGPHMLILSAAITFVANLSKNRPALVIIVYIWRSMSLQSLVDASLGVWAIKLQY